jgi:hypothetical protein
MRVPFSLPPTLELGLPPKPFIVSLGGPLAREDPVGCMRPREFFAGTVAFGFLLFAEGAPGKIIWCTEFKKKQ